MKHTHLRRTAAVLGIAVLCTAAACICIGIGTVRFTAGETVRALFVEDDSAARLLIWNLRVPRVLTGALVGICLSIAGCLLQGVMRNSLASPSTVGVTSGASLIGHLTLAAFPSYAHLLPIGSIAGAFAATLLIYLLAYRRGVRPLHMILAGMAVSALFGACSDVIRTLFADALGNVSGFLVGGLNGAGWETFRLILPYAATGLFVCLFLPRHMNILLLGDESANALGLRTELLRFLLIAVSSLLAGAAIAAAGLISFVGLIVPHIARLLFGADYRYLFPASAFLGALLVIVCDTLGRVILPPGEIPVSIILSLIGAPFFLWLLHSRRDGGP